MALATTIGYREYCGSSKDVCAIRTDVSDVSDLLRTTLLDEFANLVQPYVVCLRGFYMVFYASVAADSNHPALIVVKREPVVHARAESIVSRCGKIAANYERLLKA